MVDETFDDVAEAKENTSSSKGQQLPKEEDARESKLRYGRQRHARLAEKNKQDAKYLEGFSKSPKRKTRGALSKDSSSPSEIQAAEPLPKLTLIKRPKRKISSLPESYFIENKTKGAKTDLKEDVSKAVSPDTTETTEDTTLKSKKVSPLSLYCDLDGTSVISAICKRFKRRPTKSVEPEVNKVNSKQEDTSNVIINIIEELLTSIEENFAKQIKTINFESPGEDEEMVLKNFCLNHNMNFNDFSDMSVFTIKPPIQEEKAEVEPSKYTQVPKKRRHSSRCSSTTLSTTSSRGYNLRNKGSTATVIANPKEDEYDSISSEETVTQDIKTEHIPKTEEPEAFECFQEQSSPEVTVKQDDSISEKEEREIKNCVETLLANTQIVDDIQAGERDIELDEEIQHPQLSIETDSKESDTSPSPKEEPKSTTDSALNETWPLDLSNKTNMSPQYLWKTSSPSSNYSTTISLPNSLNKNDALYSKTSPLPVKRSLTVRKLLSMNREKKHDPLKYASPSPSPVMDQFSSKNISEEDESILKTLLLDSNKTEINENPSVLSFMNNSQEEPATRNSPDLIKNKHHQDSFPIQNTSFNPPAPSKDSNLFLEKISKLKNEISCLNVMADQKEKERVAILCFKRYKEELLKKILKRHHNACQKEQFMDHSERKLNLTSFHKSTRGTHSPMIDFPARNSENFSMETFKLERPIKMEPKPLEMSPLMAQLSQKKMLEIPKLNTSNNSALKEQLMAKPKMLPKIAPKPSKPYPNIRNERDSIKYSKMPHSRLQAPIWYPLAVPSVSKTSSKSVNSSPTQEVIATDLYVQKCSTCRLRNASFLCSRCQKEWYCSTRCQAIQWPSHSVVCNQ